MRNLVLASVHGKKIRKVLTHKKRETRAGESPDPILCALGQVYSFLICKMMTVGISLKWFLWALNELLHKIVHDTEYSINAYYY